MKWIISILLFIFFQSQSCKKEAAIKIPACIQEKIDAIQQQPRFNPPATVYRYLYEDRYVYLFSSNCCDQYDYLYDKDCTIICAPGGGITGKGDGRCSNFSQMASDKTLIWKDTR
ncbi:MAG: DUF6970 domain-containing protein [Chitinophagales bacterium]